MTRLRTLWQRSPFRGGLLGIASVAAATAVVGAACAAVAILISLIY